MLSNSPPSLPPVHPTDFLPPLSQWLKFSGLFVTGAVGLAIVLASVIQYKVTIKAQATVRPTGELRLVQAALDGSIQQITVAENQPIRRGEVLAVIDDSRLQIQKNQLQTNIAQAQRQILQINAQIQALDHQIAAETDRRDRLVASAEAEMTQRHREYRDRQITADAAVEEARANLQSAEAGLRAARVRVNRYQPVTKAGALSEDRLEEATLEMQQQEQAVAAARAKLHQAEAALNPTAAEVAIATQRIAEARASGAATLADLHKEREALIQQRIQLQNQLDRDLHELQQVELDLSKTPIRATADGVISKLTLRNSGQTVRLGEEIAQIVPSTAQPVVKALVTAQDISKIEVGQKAQMRISACPYPDYGTLTGIVKTIAADALPPQSAETPVPAAARVASPTGSAQATGYEVTIAPDRLALSRGAKQCLIQLGMEGRVDIITREETVLRFLLRRARLISDL